jgi:hypothetical protein
VSGKRQRPGGGSKRPAARTTTTRGRPAATSRPTAASAKGHPIPVDDHRGDRILVASWASVALFLIVAVPAAAGVAALDDPAVAVALSLFAIGLLVWVWSFAVAIARTTRGDNVVVSNLYFLAGSAPRRVQWHLFGALAASIAVAAGTAASDPFGVLVPMLPLGFNGLWAARHGVFPPRPVRDDTSRRETVASSGRRRGGRPGE